jgi:hypothetical protein
MTEQPDASVEVVDQPEVEPAQPSNDADPGAEPQEPELARLSREAAARRRELRQTEAERDRLRERVDGMERREVERIALGRRMISPADLWTLGVTLDQLRDDDGNLDGEKVREVVDSTLADRPHWKQRPSPGDGGARDSGPAPPRRQPGLSDLLGGR